MRDNIKLAWRNLWRNKRRTLITTASVFFAIFFALVMRSMQLGAYGHMFTNAIESYTGYIQIQHEDFWDDKTVEKVFPYSEELNSKILKDKNVETTIKRFESFALASNGPQTKGVMVMGIDPVNENLLSKVEERVVKYRLTDEAVEQLNKENLPEKVKENIEIFRNTSYSNISRLQLDLAIEDDQMEEFLPFFEKYASFKNGYIKTGEPGALLGDRLARYLQVNVGDTLILFGQGYHGATAAGKYEIKGIVKMPMPDIDSRIVYLPVDVCQDLFGAENMLTSMILHLDKNGDDAVDATVKRIAGVVEKPLRVIDWKVMNEIMISQMDADNKGGMIFIAILYMVIAFGVFGTVLMMTAERRREFGVLVAVGMQKTKLAIVMCFEMLFMGLVGIASGVIASIPVVLAGYYNPIRFSGDLGKMFEDYGMEPVMPFLWFDTYYYWQALVVLVIVLIAMIHPVKKIMKLQVINALRA